jgi:L-seryl-tRNA(Ser) seleniumtransferase
VTINPYMMSPGENRIVAEALHAILSHPPGPPSSPPRPPSVDLTGEWEVEVRYAAGRSTHRLFLHQTGAALAGSHRGDFVERPVEGEIHGAGVEMRSVVTEKQDGNSLRYTFEGTVSGDTMGGSLDLGEYLGARWTARRRA